MAGPSHWPMTAAVTDSSTSEVSADPGLDMGDSDLTSSFAAQRPQYSTIQGGSVKAGQSKGVERFMR